MENVSLIKFREIGSSTVGHLTPVEAELDIPFKINRIYYIYDVGKGERRGFHSHRNLKQVLICVNGSVKILVKTPLEERVFTLDKPYEGLYIGPMIWREMFDFSEGSVLLVLASENFSEDDYIRAYSLYEKEYIRCFSEGSKYRIGDNMHE